MAADKRARAKGRLGESKERHVRLHYWVMATEAWNDLDTVARCAYVELLKLYRGSNNGRIALGVRTLGDSLKVAPTTAARALRSLEAHGFIQTVTRGAFSRKVRHASEYRLTEHGCDASGALPSKEFASWRKNTVHVVTPIGARHDTDRYTS
jgi:hypothetical protein